MTSVKSGVFRARIRLPPGLVEMQTKALLVIFSIDQIILQQDVNDKRACQVCNHNFNQSLMYRLSQLSGILWQLFQG